MSSSIRIQKGEDELLLMAQKMFFLQLHSENVCEWNIYIFYFEIKKTNFKLNKYFEINKCIA